MRYLTVEQILYGEELTDEELKKLSTTRLFKLFKYIRALAESRGWGARYRCCEICHEWIGTDKEYEGHVAKPSGVFYEYKLRIKRELDSRPDQFSHRKKKKAC